jgi:outer membrane protein assembly factor BamB
VFLTSFDDTNRTLEVLCLSRESGTVKWRKPIAAAQIEPVHRVSSPATGTPACDGQRVVCYFGSCGAVSFDLEGNELWRYEMPAAKTVNGTGSSPILLGGRAVINRDSQGEHYLLALGTDKGDTLWKSDYQWARIGFGPPPDTVIGGQSTPIVWNDWVVVHRPNAIDGYTLADGKRAWTFPVATTGCSTPVAGDGRLYVMAWNNVGEPDLVPPPPAFEELVRRYDADKNGDISREELPADLPFAARPEVDAGLGGNITAKFIFSFIDSDRNGAINASEWQAQIDRAANAPTLSEHGLLALEPSADPMDSTPKQVWKLATGIGEVPSPLFVDGRVYMLANGGILTCIDAALGGILYRGRCGPAGAYYASPVAGDGKLLVVSAEGKLTILAQGDEFKVLGRIELGEPVLATPAIVDGRLYLRTDRHLFAFGK